MTTDANSIAATTASGRRAANAPTRPKASATNDPRRPSALREPSDAPSGDASARIFPLVGATGAREKYAMARRMGFWGCGA